MQGWITGPGCPRDASDLAEAAAPQAAQGPGLVTQSQPWVGLRPGLMAGPRRLGGLELGGGFVSGPLAGRCKCRRPAGSLSCRNGTDDTTGGGGKRDASCCFRDGGLAAARAEAPEHGMEPAGGGSRSRPTCRVWAPGSLHGCRHTPGAAQAAKHKACPRSEDKRGVSGPHLEVGFATCGTVGQSTSFPCLRILLCDVGTSAPTSESLLENRFLAHDGPAVEARPARRLLAAAAPPGRPLPRAELTGPRGSCFQEPSGRVWHVVSTPSRPGSPCLPVLLSLLLPGPHPALPEGVWGCRWPWRGTWGPGGREALPASPPPRSTCASQPHYPPGVWPSTSCWSP
ncbi:uncharacterized protein [Vulpes vulpes]|uniref:Uncharacterized protein n=1 Tax=Vulpes vulpes TaxID=9627 RepID=A0A3Q7R0U4_VULVU